MVDRIDLQTTLQDILGSKNVYYDPPESLKISYPAIIYSKSGLINKKADDTNYRINTIYEITVIDKRPDNAVIKKLLELPYCSYDRHFVSDNLHHDTLTIYI